MALDDLPSVDTLRVDISYRPIRVGWVIRSDDFESFRIAVRLSYALWGGRFNPILFADRIDESTRLIERFRVDLIWPLGDAVEVKSFPSKFPHLRTHFLHDALFGTDHRGGKYCQLLDLQNLLTYVTGRPEWAGLRAAGLNRVAWEDEDPLRDVLLVQYGGFPNPQDAPDYSRMLDEAFGGTKQPIAADGQLSGDFGKQLTIPALSRLGMDRHYGIDARRDSPGFFLGDAGNLDDLAFHWNLRAADIPLLFIDANYLPRYGSAIPAWHERMRQLVAPRHEFDRHVAVWARRELLDERERIFPGMELIGCSASDVLWNGLNVQVPMMQYGSSSTLGVVSRRQGKPKVTFALNDKPFASDSWFFTQHLVASVSCGIGWYGDEQHTFAPPYVPELNEFCARQMHFEPDKLRLEPGRVGLVIDPADSDTFLSALPVGEMVEQFMALAGYHAAPSGAGRIVRQLITRLGGVQGARVFKIPGVRRLLRTYGPTDTFTKAGALQLIGGRDQDNPAAKFSDHHRLYIESRERGDLRPTDVFGFMAAKGLFRLGAELLCPSCRLSSWVSLDALRHEAACELCGRTYDATRQLVDEQWRYRRSGILGTERNSQGAIPVALTLQQLETNLRGSLGEAMYTTSLDLSPMPGSTHGKCEVDFAWVIARPNRQRTAIILGECKDRGPLKIAEFREAVDGLHKLALALPKERFKTFVLLTKLAPFTSEEIEVARTLNDERHLRAILLTDQELEPYDIYERSTIVSERRKYASTPEDLAWATFEQYFGPLGDRAAIGMDA